MSASTSQSDCCGSSFFLEIQDLYDRQGIRFIVLHRFWSLFGKRILIFPVKPDVVLGAEHFEIIR